MILTYNVVFSSLTFNTRVLSETPLKIPTGESVKKKSKIFDLDQLFLFFFSAYLPGISGTRCRTSSMAKLPAAAARAGPTIVSADVWPRIVSVCSGTDIPRDF